MAADLLRELSELLLVTSIALLLIAALRKPVRKRFGARVAYALWLALPLAALATLLPAPTAPVITARALGSASSIGQVGTVTEQTITIDPQMWLSLWLGGVALSLLWIGRQQCRFQRELGELQPATDGSHRSPRATAPALVGLLQPRIVLPSDFEQRYSPGEQALVLAHERSHLRHGDAWANAAAAFALCLLWFHPLAWWAIGRFRFDQELACDARVLDAAPQSRRAYADALLKTQLHADIAWRLPLGCHWQSSHPLTERVAMLKTASMNRPRRLLGLVAVLALCSAGAFTAWATQPGTPSSAADTSQYDLDFRIRVDRSITAAPSIRVASGEPFEFKVEEGDVAVTGAMRVTEQSDGSLLLDAELRRNGEIIGKPKLKFLPDSGARIEIGSEPGQMLEVDIAANVVKRAETTSHGDEPKRSATTVEQQSLEAPQLVQATQPKYPASAVRDDIGGTVVLRVLVNPDGSASEISVEESSGHESLDQSAISSAAQWRFNPGRKHGKSVGGWVLVPVTFSPDEHAPDATQTSKS